MNKNTRFVVNNRFVKIDLLSLVVSLFLVVLAALTTGKAALVVVPFILILLFLHSLIIKATEIPNNQPKENL